MLLSTEDVRRLERKGYLKEFFVLLDKDGYFRLRNLQKRCVFYNIEKKQCTVYRFRPSGCRLYPAVYDEEKGIVLDEVCRARGKLNEKQMTQRGLKVLKLLDRIDAQAEKRRNLQ